MKIQTVLFKPPSIDHAVRYSVTPEMNAAVSARHSRTPEGLDEIMRKVSELDENKAIDAIFKFTDYGHASILDMIPVSIHMEGVSLFFAQMVWYLVKVGGGQEQSTRYNTMQGEDNFYGGETDFTRECKKACAEAASLWSELSASDQAVKYLGDPSMPPAKLERLRRNFIFDRARYFIPMSTKTNMNVTTWGREWIKVCSLLASSPWKEFRDASVLIREELKLASPRLVKHSEATDNGAAFWSDLVNSWGAVADYYETFPSEQDVSATFSCLQIVDLSSSSTLPRTNRYHLVDDFRRTIPVHYGWVGVAIAELRDMNRHRPGERLVNMCPSGFYCAQDQFAEFGVDPMRYNELENFGTISTEQSFKGAKARDPEFVYNCLLGAMVSFSHSSTLGNLIYECELRTGPGTHYRYRNHYLDLVEEMKKTIPNLGPMLIGTGEPE